jgi:hypothetical protein
MESRSVLVRGVERPVRRTRGRQTKSPAESNRRAMDSVGGARDQPPEATFGDVSLNAKVFSIESNGLPSISTYG